MFATRITKEPQSYADIVGVVELSFCCSAELEVLYGKVECMIPVDGGISQQVY
jgi:hypothetical protein